MKKLPLVNDAGLVALYEALKKRNAGSFTSLDDAGRREYFRMKRRDSRARERKATAEGGLFPTPANVRDVLADAALMILATGAPGVDQVRQVLVDVFADRPAVPETVEHAARHGRLRPKHAAKGNRP